jgi:hypothetical protein
VESFHHPLTSSLGLQQVPGARGNGHRLKGNLTLEQMVSGRDRPCRGRIGERPAAELYRDRRILGKSGWREDIGERLKPRPPIFTSRPLATRFAGSGAASVTKTTVIPPAI